MTLQDFKNQILTRTFSRDFLILVSEENSFLADQYIDKLCEQYHCEINLISSLKELEDASVGLVFDFQADNIINILKTDTFSESFSDYSKFTNCIVLCGKIDKALESSLISATIKIPKLMDWQVKDYIYTCCPGLDEQAISWLYDVCKRDIYKIQTEIDKIKLFPISDQLKILNDLRFLPGSYLYTQTEYTLKDALKTNNKAVLFNYILHRRTCKVDPNYLLNQLIRDFKVAYFVGYTQKSSVELGLTDKQYYVIRKNIPAEKFLLQSLKFLTELEVRLKTGEISLSTDLLIDYIICNILNNYEHY